jgi:hypothetical protein
MGCVVKKPTRSIQNALRVLKRSSRYGTEPTTPPYPLEYLEQAGTDPLSHVSADTLGKNTLHIEASYEINSYASYRKYVV